MTRMKYFFRGWIWSMTSADSLRIKEVKGKQSKSQCKVSSKTCKGQLRTLKRNSTSGQFYTSLDSCIGLESVGSRCQVRLWGSENHLYSFGVMLKIFCSRLYQNHVLLLSWLLQCHHLGFPTKFIFIVLMRWKFALYSQYSYKIQDLLRIMKGTNSNANQPQMTSLETPF